MLRTCLLATRLLVRVDTEPLLDTVLTVGLPQVVEGGEQVSGVTTHRGDGGDGGALVLLGWDRDTVGLALGRPAGLGDDDVLGAVAGGPDALDLLEEPLAGVGGDGVLVEEGVGVDGHVVGVLAELRVVDHGDEGVDGDDWAGVAGGLEGGAAGGDVLADLGRGGLAAVDELVADGHGHDVVPGAVLVDGGLHGVDAGLDLVDEEDAEEDLLGGGLGLQDVGDLVAVDAVQSDGGVLGQLGEVLGDLGGGAAGTVGVVRGVSNTLDAGGASRSGGASGDDGRSLGGVGSSGSSSWGGSSGGSSSSSNSSSNTLNLSNLDSGDRAVSLDRVAVTVNIDSSLLLNSSSDDITLVVVGVVGWRGRGSGTEHSGGDNVGETHGKE